MSKELEQQLTKAISALEEITWALKGIAEAMKHTEQLSQSAENNQ